ncbi:MAG: hypothetical protein HUJ89_07620 [Bacteroidales bacterium]|nr:hypothetical protein [Bacteroidales bacterium]
MKENESLGQAQKQNYEKPSLVEFEIQSEGALATSGSIEDFPVEDWING